MMTLSDQAATGSADWEAVAIALGCARSESGWWFWGGIKIPRRHPPDYQNDIVATLAEIERRGWGYELSSLGKMFCEVWVNYEKHEATGTTIANAACAALLKALENSDG